jgi:hypothetical protein
MQIKDLNTYCSINRERQKRRKTKSETIPKKKITGPVQTLPGPNDPKAPKSKQPVSNKSSIVSPPVQEK